MNKNNANKAYFIALASAAFLSSTAILIRYLTLNYKMPALVLAFWRDFFVVITILPILFFRQRDLLKIDKEQGGFLLIYGFILAIFNSFWTLSVAFNGAAVATVLCYCSAAFTAILGKWFLNEELTWVKSMAILCSLAGCVLVSGAFDMAVWHTNLVGILSGILSGLAYAAYSLMGRSASQRGLNPWTTLLFTFAFAGTVLLIVNMFPALGFPGIAQKPTDLFWLGADWRGWLPLFLLAAVPTVLGFGLYNVSLQYLPASVVNLIATSEPVFTTITAFLVFGERMHALELLGSVLVLGGVVILRLGKNKKSGIVVPLE
jgi:drug/metabolite transporter (DMT)-like permease